MTHYRSLNHSKWACQYHEVFIPQYRKKAIYGELHRYLGEVLRRLARQRESEVEEGHLLVDHVHMMLSIPPKYSVAQVIGYIKGKSAIHIAREFAGRSRSFVGQHFGARGYFVSTLGRDERAIRAYIRAQELEDRRHEQLRLDERSHPEGGPSGRVAATSGRCERLTTKSPRLCRGIFTVALEWEAMVLVGRVARAHGNRGRVIVNPESDFVEDRFRAGNTVYVRHGDRVERLSIRDVRFHQHRPIVAFDEVATMTEAEQLASAELRVPMETLDRLPAGVFYHHELTGCRVETVEGTVVGMVSAVEGDGGVYRLVVDGGSAEILVPLVDEICVRIDLAAAAITIDPPEGLLDLNPPPRRRAETSRRS